MEAHAVRVGWIYQPPTREKIEISPSRLISDGLVVWEGSKFTYVGRFDRSKIPPDSELIHYPKAILLPPFINGHTHIAETLIRGLVEDVELETWLYDHVWKVEPQMTADDARVGTQLAVAEMVSTGTIGIIDQFYYSDEICQVLAETGMKGIVCPSIFPDNPETGSAENALRRNLEIIDKWDNHDNRLKVGFGPHALYTVDHDLFVEIGNLAKEKDTWIHTHVSETHHEVKQADEAWGMSPVEKLDDLDLLDYVLASHCVHVSPSDIELLKKHSVTVLHNIQSNLKIGSGIAPIPDLIDNQVNVVLGTDGNASNNNLAILEEIRLTALIHKGIHHNPRLVPIETAIQMATTNHHQVFGDIYTGRLEKNAPSDFTIFSLDHPSGTPILDPVSNLVYSVNPSDCIMTVSDGRILYQDGNFLTLDIEVIKENVQQSSNRMIETADYDLMILDKYY